MTPIASFFTLTGLGVGLVIASSLVEHRPILVWECNRKRAPWTLLHCAPNWLTGR
jgi:hypothetical protein